MRPPDRERLVVQLIALAARRNGSHQHAIANLVSAHPHAQLVDDSHGLVADDQPRLHRVFPFEDVKVRAADRCQRDANDRFTRSGLGNWYLFNPDLVWAMKNERPHLGSLRCLFLRKSFLKSRSHISLLLLCGFTSWSSRASKDEAAMMEKHDAKRSTRDGPPRVGACDPGRF